MKFGLCKDCEHSKLRWCGGFYHCDNPVLQLNNSNAIKCSFPLDFGCSYFKPKINEKESVETLNNRRRIVELEKRLRDVESFIRILEKPEPNKLHLVDSYCWGCVYVNIMRGKCDHPDCTSSWVFPSVSCVDKTVKK